MGDVGEMLYFEKFVWSVSFVELNNINSFGSFQDAWLTKWWNFRKKTHFF